MSRGSLVALVVASGAALFAVTCQPSEPVAPVASAASAASAASVAPVTPSASAADPPVETAVSTAAPAAVVADAVLPRTLGHELPNFYAALRGLEQHTRSSHVRVAWLGDSHGAADIWSGALRTALQAKFGAGGPGFVHVGYKAYRHDGLKVDVRGKWVTSPRGASTITRTGDGIFGLGGVLLSGAADDPHASISLTDATLPPALSWDLCYKLASPSEGFRLTITGQPDRIVKAEPNEPLGTLRHLTFTTSTAEPSLRVVPMGGEPHLCGVTVETDPKTRPGVVLDTLGINGARLATTLAWTEIPWVEEVKRRAPSLVVIEYGTNESGDTVIRPSDYEENLAKLVARVRRATPAADCIVLAPTDRADTQEKSPRVRDALREAAKKSLCAFWDTYEIMGGKGSIMQWREESPPRAGKDGVHLTAKGYLDLGERLAKDILAGYAP